MPYCRNVRRCLAWARCSRANSWASINVSQSSICTYNYAVLGQPLSSGASVHREAEWDNRIPGPCFPYDKQGHRDHPLTRWHGRWTELPRLDFLRSLHQFRPWSPAALFISLAASVFCVCGILETSSKCPPALSESCDLLLFSHIGSSRHSADFAAGGWPEKHLQSHIQT